MNKIKKIDSQTERKVLTGLIVSKSFCSAIVPIAKSECFSATYSQRVFEWASDYFKKYKESINEEIKTIYDRECQRLPEEEQNLIGELLLSISNEFEEDSHYNSQFWIDKALEWLKEKNLEKTVEHISKNLELGRIREAENSLLGYNVVAKETSSVVRLDYDTVDQITEDVFNREETELFTVPGVIGQIQGPVRRQGVHGILSMGKAGKSFMLMEMALAAVASGWNTLISSHEMDTREIYERIVHMLSKRPMKQENEISTYAVMDCKKNKFNKCKQRRLRTNTERYLNNDKSINEAYQPCTACREMVSDDFEVDFINREITKPFVTKEEANKRLRKFLKWENGAKLFVVGFPKFSANFKDVENEINYIRNVYDVDIDVLCDDYINAHKTFNRDRRIGVDDEWKEAARIASEYKIAVASPIHSNRDGIKEGTLDVTNISESQSIFNHVTNIIAMDGVDEFSAYNVIRLRKLADRFDGYIKKDTAYLIQNLNHGQVAVDGYFQKYIPDRSSGK